MDIWDENKLMVFIGFAVPGFISLKAYQLLCPGQTKDSSQQLVDAVAYSCINYALLLWPIAWVENHDVKKSAPNLYAAFWLLVFLVAPIVWACALRWLRTKEFFLRRVPHPTAKPWDFVFGQRKEHYVVVKLKDGSALGGFYGTKSFTSSAPDMEQIYLQDCWHLDDEHDFQRKKKATAGILILGSEIASIELIDPHHGEADEREEDAEQPGNSAGRLDASSQRISTEQPAFEQASRGIPADNERVSAGSSAAEKALVGALLAAVLATVIHSIRKSSKT